MVVTPGYTELFEARELEPSSITETIAQQGRTVVIGAFAPLASFALFHMVTVFPLSWVFLFTREAPGRFLIVECIGAVFGIIAMIVSGYVADKVGRRTLAEPVRRLPSRCSAASHRRCWTAASSANSPSW